MHDINFRCGQTKIYSVVGNIAEQRADAIVNAANSTLMGGGGVDDAIHKAGGPAILKECKVLRRELWPNGLPAGMAVMTTAGLLNAKYVIHTVGPRWNAGESGDANILADCYKNCLKIAFEKNLRSIAFPAISTGAYGCPLVLGSGIALMTVARYVWEAKWPEEVFFVLFSNDELAVFETIARAIGGLNVE